MKPPRARHHAPATPPTADNIPDTVVTMFCCYLIHHGRISQRHEIAVATLHEAIVHGRQLLGAHPATGADSGIEIWRDRSLLFSDQRHTDQTGIPAPLDSPFATAESTMLPTSCPSRAQSLALVMFKQDPAASLARQIPAEPALAEPVCVKTAPAETTSAPGD